MGAGPVVITDLAQLLKMLTEYKVRYFKTSEVEIGFGPKDEEEGSSASAIGFAVSGPSDDEDDE